MSIPTATSAPRISEWKVLRGGLVVGLGLVTGQALGFLRQATIAYLLGTGPHADALAVALAPVDLWFSVLATAVIFGYGPLLAARRSAGEDAAFSDLALPVVRLSLAAAALVMLFAPWLVHLLAPGLPVATAELASRLLRITALGLPAMSSSTVFTALLYSERRFAFPAFHQSMVNFCTISGALLSPASGAFAFAAGYVAGAWLQLAAAWIICRPPLRSPQPLRLRAVLAAPAPVLLYSLLVGLNPVITRALASTFGSGSTASFDYGLKMLGVPLAILVTPLSSSLISEIAPFRLRSSHRTPLATIGRAALATAAAATAIVVAMHWMGTWIIALLFERGQFTSMSTTAVNRLLLGFFPSLAAWSALDIMSRSLFSLGKPRIPILGAGVALVVNAAVAGLFPAKSLEMVGLGAVAGLMTAALVVAAYVWKLQRSHGH